MRSTTNCKYSVDYNSDVHVPYYDGGNALLYAVLWSDIGRRRKPLPVCLTTHASFNKKEALGHEAMSATHVKDQANLNTNILEGKGV